LVILAIICRPDFPWENSDCCSSFVKPWITERNRFKRAGLTIGNAIPVGGWDWPRFLKFAPNYMVFAISKSIAKERWGSENYFNAGMGGRSLRFTGTLIYGSPVDRPGMSVMHQQVDHDVKSSKKEQMQKEVGGVAAWEALELDLERFWDPVDSSS
jgi:hypothetical protein